MAVTSEASEHTRPAGFAEISRAVVSAAADLVGTVERAVVGDANVRTARGNAWAALCADRARAQARDEMDRLVRALLANGPRSRAVEVSSAADAAAAEVSRVAAGTSGAGRSEAGRPEAGRSEAGRSEAGRSEAGRSEAGRSTGGGGSGASRSRPGAPKRNDGRRQSATTRGNGQNQPATSRRRGHQRAAAPRTGADRTSLASAGSSAR